MTDRQKMVVVFTAVILASLLFSMWIVHDFNQLLDCMAVQAGTDTIARLAACT